MTDEDVLSQWLRTALLQRQIPGVTASTVPRVKLRICQTCNRQSDWAFEAPANPVIKQAPKPSATPLQA